MNYDRTASKMQLSVIHKKKMQLSVATSTEELNCSFRVRVFPRRGGFILYSGLLL